MDGPVVLTAMEALKKGDVTPVLKWVNEEGEKEVREAFDLARKVRVKGENAQKLADRHFFETLVRVHRAGEGVGFTGLKPAGSIAAGFVEADHALEKGKVDELARRISQGVEQKLRERFAEVVEKKKHAEHSVEAGRKYVAAYVRYAHFVEGIEAQISGSGEGHGTEHAEGHGESGNAKAGRSEHAH